jgi:RNA polymerase sigma factor (sigma-70 family)
MKNGKFDGEGITYWLQLAARAQLLTPEEEFSIGDKINDSYANLLCLLLGTREGPKELETFVDFLDSVDLSKDRARFSYRGEPYNSAIERVQSYQRVRDFYRANPWSLAKLVKRSDSFRRSKVEGLAEIIAGNNKNYLEKLLILPVRERLRLSGSKQLELYDRLASEFIDEIDGDKQRFTEANLRLVVSTAKYYFRRGMHPSDVISEGNFGVMMAVGIFDYTLGTKFSGLGISHVRRKIEKALQDKVKVIRIPGSMGRLIKDINDLRNESRALGGMEPSVSDLVKELKRPERTILRAIEIDQSVLSLDYPMNDESEPTTFGEGIQDRFTRSPREIFEQEEEQRIVLGLLPNLKDRSQLVLKMRFGIGFERTHTLDEVAKVVNLTRERVRQIEVAAIKKLRMSNELDELRVIS